MSRTWAAHPPTLSPDGPGQWMQSPNGTSRSGPLLSSPIPLQMALVVLALVLAPWVHPPPAIALPQDSPPTTLTMLANDAIPRPPQLRHIPSPTGAYHLLLTASPARDDRSITATLFETTPDRCQRVWTRPLPQEYGPRLALVTDIGQTLLLDEWINVASAWAIVVLNSAGEVIAQYSFGDIVTVTGSTRAAVVEQAEQGFWLAGTPTLRRHSPRHGRPPQVEVPTAGGTLTIDMETGQLRF
jgi:hypothetical protein